MALPILSYRDDILKSITENQTTIIVGETGCGKSTQLPQFIADFNSESANSNKKRKLSNVSTLTNKQNCQQIVCTQPRRVAAVTIATKVASERQKGKTFTGIQLDIVVNH